MCNRPPIHEITDSPRGPRDDRRLSQAYAAAARRLPPRAAGDDPAPTRSSLNRCFQRHDIARFPEMPGDKPRRSKFRSCPIGYVPVDLAEMRTEQDKLYMFVANHRSSKFAFVELHENSKSATGPADRSGALQDPYCVNRQRPPVRHAGGRLIGRSADQGGYAHQRTPLGARLRMRRRPKRH